MDDISGRIRDSLNAGRQNNIVYHVERPGHEGYTERVLQAWGVDGQAGLQCHRQAVRQERNEDVSVHAVRKLLKGDRYECREDKA